MLTKAFKRIDLDSLPLPYVERMIHDNARRSKQLGPHEKRRDRFVGSRQWKTLGFKPENLLDWRSLERRWYQLHGATRQASEALWDIYRSLSKYSLEHSGGGEVWMPDRSGEYVEVYRVDDRSGEGSLGSEPVKRLIDRAIPDPDLKPFVVFGEDLWRLHRYKGRIDAMRRRAGAYSVAFRLSVEARLEAYATAPENRLPFSRYAYCNPCAFVFSNDDRAYLITSSESGALTWHDSVEVRIDGLGAA